MDYNSPKINSTGSMTSSNAERPTTYGAKGLLGNTIEEKTRRILGWTEHTAPSLTNGPLNTSVVVGQHQRKAEKGRKTRSASLISTAPYPYSLLANDSNRGRKNSCPSLCNTNETAILRQQLTPPPSPVSTHNGISIVSLPRQDRPSSLNPPPPPAYHTIPSSMYAARNPSCDSVADNNCTILDYPSSLPISPVSPAPCVVISDDRASTTAASAPIRISTSEVFERLRKEVPHIPKETSKFRVLVQTVANVIELETKLAQLQEQTRTLSSMLISQSGKSNPACQGPATSYEKIAIDTSSPAASLSSSEASSLVSCRRVSIGSLDVPDDLQGIDVTAFKSMMCSPHGFPASSTPSTPFHSSSVMWMKSNSANSFSANAGIDYMEGKYDCGELFNPLHFSSLDPLLVDTSI